MSSSPRIRKRSQSGSDYEAKNFSDTGDDHGSEGVRDSKFKKRLAEAKLVEVRLLISAKDAGLVIGKAGSNIKRIRQDLKANVSISENRTPERIITISCELDLVVDVAEDIFRTFEEKHKSEREPYQMEAKLLIHHSQAGCVIGKAGSQLKEFRKEHNVDIKVFAECCPRSTERIAQMKGKVSDTARCLAAVVELIRTWPAKGYYDRYDPFNYDGIAVREYGGYPDEGGDRYSKSYDRDRSYDRGGRRNSDRERDDYRDSYRDSHRGLLGSPRSSSAKTTQQVTIPTDLAGVIIGKGGQNIRQIRQDSGAQIDVSEITTSSNNRIISITGSPGQIQNAQYMLQMSVKKHLANEEIGSRRR